jgi:mRNA-degrading endonuclease toxin of MazEF toxin-antitoxin module
MNQQFHRGDVWFVRFGVNESPLLALIISREDEDGIMPVIAVVPHEARAAETEFDAPVTTRFMSEGIFNTQRLTALRPEQFVQHLGVIAPQDMDSVERCLYRWLDL